MKSISFRTLQVSIGLGVSYLAVLELAHFAKPADPWNKMLVKPAFVVILPLLVACVPLLADGLGSSTIPNHRSGHYDTTRRMLATWLISLLVFISPHYFGTASLDPVVHTAWFLGLAPLLLGLLPLVIRPGRTRPAGDSVCHEEATAARERRTFFWKGVVGSLFLALLDIALACVMIPTAATKGGATFDTIYFLIPCLLLLWRAGHYIRRLRNA